MPCSPQLPAATALDRAALDKLSEVVENGGNVFAELLNAVEVCSLGQITERHHEVAGVYQSTVSGGAT